MQDAISLFSSFLLSGLQKYGDVDHYHQFLISPSNNAHNVLNLLHFAVFSFLQHCLLVYCDDFKPPVLHDFRNFAKAKELQ
jgi:hypothetical protein